MGRGRDIKELRMLRVYELSLAVCRDAARLARLIAKYDGDLARQLRKAAWSAPINVAEAQGVTGGNSRMRFCTALGSSYDAHVIPHGHNIHDALHVVASQSPMTCPLVEVLILKMQTYYYFDKSAPQVVDGKLELSSRPGFGMELDDAKIRNRTRQSWS